MLNLFTLAEYFAIIQLNMVAVYNLRNGESTMPTLEWIGKEKVINHHQDVPYRVLERHIQM